jgi:hypothetical protein
VVNNWIPLFGFAKNEWNGTQWNPFHPIPSIPSIFHSPQFGVYAME